MLILPTPRDGYPDENVRVALDGSTYVIRWLLNEREGLWTFSIADADGVPILSGVRVVLNVDLLALSADERRPPGPILVVDSSGSMEEPTQQTLGKSVKVVYLPEAELP